MAFASRKQNRIRGGKRGRRLFFLMALSVVLSLPSAPSFAQAGAYQKGEAFYKAGQYQKAIGAFTMALRQRRGDPSVYYYIAACYHQLKNLPQAKQYYVEAINYGGLSKAGTSALKGLSAIDPALSKSLYTQLMAMSGGRVPQARTSSSPSAVSSRTIMQIPMDTTSSSNPGDLVAPRESFISFTKPTGSGAAYVDAFVNNRRVQMLYDTGAEMCLFGKNTLSELGLRPPSGPPTGQSMGVGSGGLQKTWHMNVTLKVGQVERKNFPITVQESTDTPLLGQSFFQDFKYDIDNQAHRIHMMRNDAQLAAASRSSIYEQKTTSNDVPFRREGREMVVDVQVNGRVVPMIFDTGADQIVFATQHVSAAGLSVPQDADEQIINGIAGQSTAKKFSVSRIKLGPVEKTNVTVLAVEGHETLPHPLLGQTFFGAWRFSIDNNNRLIKFHSRSGADND